MQRILFVAHDSGMFGAQRSLLTILQGLDRTRFDCRVVAPYEGAFTEEVARLGMPFEVRQMVRWVPEANVLAREGRWRYMRSCLGGLRARAWAIAGLIERHRADLVYTNTVVAVEAAVAARMAKVAHLWHVLEPIAGNPELGALWPDALYSRAIGALSERVVFCSQSLAAAYPGLAARARVVRNGLPMPTSFDRAQAREALGRELGLPPSTRVVAVVGAIQPRKDHRTFLAAAARVAQRHRDVAFIIVGSGNAELTTLLQAMVSSLGLGRQVHLLGWWPGRIHELLAGVDLLVISSIQESFGLSAIEALAVETPVVATRCGGPQEILRDGVDGLLTPVGAAEPMAQAIGRLLDNPLQARQFGQTGRAHVAATLSVKHFVEQIQTVMTEAVTPH